MTVEIDHLFIITDVGAPQADWLVQQGFTEGSPNHHTTQGTACRRFFFANTMLEFIWVHDAQENHSGPAQRTGLANRALARLDGGSPFGLCFRPSGATQPPPFPTWQYAPPYLPADRPAYEISSTSEIVSEPFLFYVPRFDRPDRYPPHRAEPTTHACGATELTHTLLQCPTPSVPALRALSEVPGFAAELSPSHHLHLTLDHARQGRHVRFPLLPVSIAY